MWAKNQMFLGAFSQFCQQSTGWCAQSSEAEATKINDIIVAMMEDLKRRSSVSNEAMRVLGSVKHEIAGFLTRKDVPLSRIVDTLKKLGSESGEVSDLLNPIVEGLQFQDRLRQNLENLAKIIDLWTKIRSENLSEIEFGARLLKCTTSPEERTIIRSVVAGLPEESVSAETELFF